MSNPSILLRQSTPILPLSTIHTQRPPADNVGQPPLTTNLTQLLCLKLVRLTPHTWSIHDLCDSQSQRPIVFRNLRIPVDKTASWSSAQHDQLFCCNSATAHQIRSWWQVAPKCEDDLFCGKNYGIPCPFSWKWLWDPLSLYRKTVYRPYVSPLDTRCLLLENALWRRPCFFAERDHVIYSRV